MHILTVTGLHPGYHNPLPSVVVTLFQGQGSLTLLGTHCRAHDKNKPEDLSEYIRSREERALERGKEASIHLMGSASCRAGTGVSSLWR